MLGLGGGASVHDGWPPPLQALLSRPVAECYLRHARKKLDQGVKLAEAGGKCLMHAVRLCWEAARVIERRPPRVRYEGDLRQQLLDIRQGALEVAAARRYAEGLWAETQAALQAVTGLPPAPDKDVVLGWLTKVRRQSLANVPPLLPEVASVGAPDAPAALQTAQELLRRAYAAEEARVLCIAELQLPHGRQSVGVYQLRLPRLVQVAALCGAGGREGDSMGWRCGPHFFSFFGHPHGEPHDEQHRPRSFGLQEAPSGG